MKKFPFIISILLIIFFSRNVSSQYDYYSKVIYGELNNSIQAYDICQSIDGGFILAGKGEMFGGNALVIKVDSMGNPVWNKSYFTTQSMSFFDITSTYGSSFVLGGKIFNSEHNNWDIFLIKISNSGAYSWIKNFTMDEEYSCYLTSINETSDSGFIISGYTEEYNHNPHNQALVIKTNSDGSLQWAKKYSYGDLENKAYSIKQMNNGEYLLCGYFKTSTDPYSKALITNIAENGEINWAKSYTIEDQEQSHSFTYDIDISDNEITALMSLNGSSVLIRTNLNGSVEWAKDYDANSEYYGQTPRLNKTGDNNFIFVSGFSWGKYLKTNHSGELLQSSELMLNPEDIIETTNKSLMVVGNGPLFAVKNNKAYFDNIGLIKIDSLGNTAECAESGGYSVTPISVEDSPIDVITENTGYERYQVFNLTSGYPEVRDGCVDIIGSIEEKENIESRVFPNPNSGNFTISLNQNLDGIIRISNHHGQLVYISNIVGENIKISISNLSPGIYFYQIETKNTITTAGKILIEK